MDAVPEARDRLPGRPVGIARAFLSVALGGGILMAICLSDAVEWSVVGSRPLIVGSREVGGQRVMFVAPTKTAEGAGGLAHIDTHGNVYEIQE